MSEDIEEIITRYFKVGPFESAKLTKEKTEKKSKEIKDKTWKACDSLLKEISEKFYEESHLNPIYALEKEEWEYFVGLSIELVKTLQVTFRLAEEGYYRIALGNLRDILEIVMKIKYFYNNKEKFLEWIDKPRIYNTKGLRKLLFKDTELKNEIENFSNSLSNNRHSIRQSLDSLGIVLTNLPYYRKDLFEKWCKHMILLKDLCIKIINY